MATSFAASRAQLIYALCLPLAVLMGYFLASPTEFSSIAIIVTVLSVLLVPILMKYYHPLLVACWNAALTPYFLPGAPHAWMLLSFVGFGFAVINRFTNPEAKLVQVPALNRAVVVMIAVVCATAFFRGGLGLRSLGSETFGAKNYISILGAMLGYFALISQRIPANRAPFYVSLFFLSSLTALVPNLAFLGGPKLYFLYILFPAFLAQEQASSAFSTGTDFTRFTGLTFASIGFYCWIYSKYGLRGLFEWSKPWRAALFLLAVLACVLTGFRSFLLLFLITTTLLFLAEGLFRPRVLLPLGTILLVVAGVTIPNASKLPGVVQRSLSFLPIDINPAIRQSAAVSSEWRLKMWNEVWQQIPDYLLLGKGYAINPGELQFAEENTRRGYSPDYAWALVTGEYHNGPLSVFISLGIWGGIAFGALLVTGWRYLFYQYRNSTPELQIINRFLLVFFTARAVYFLLVFGSLPFDLFSFAGILGLSVSINGAVTKAESNRTSTNALESIHRKMAPPIAQSGKKLNDQK
jgi:O-antigen ligase